VALDERMRGGAFYRCAVAGWYMRTGATLIQIK
jgi:hypothetical protein